MCEGERKKNREKRRLTCPGDRKNNSIFYYAGRENGKCTRDGVKQSRCLCGGREEGRVRVISGSCERLVLTRNCSRCLSDSGVNSADMGMTSPARIMIALREEGTDKTKVFTSVAPALRLAGRVKVSRAKRDAYVFRQYRLLTCERSPAVPGVGNVQLPQQVDDHQSRAAPRDVVDGFLSFYLHILNTHTQKCIFGSDCLMQTHPLYIATLIISL